MTTHADASVPANVRAVSEFGSGGLHLFRIQNRIEIAACLHGVEGRRTCFGQWLRAPASGCPVWTKADDPDHTMVEPGHKLKQIRERLGLRYRDVEEFSQQIADRRRNSEFLIPISRLSDIENRGVVPGIFKLYSLCAIYRLDIGEVLKWYGADPAELPADSAAVTADKTHLAGFSRSSLRSWSSEVMVPLMLDPGLDLAKTTFLSRFIQSWGVLPLMILSGHEPKNYRYGYLGMDDWFMYPILRPGSLLLIDENRRKVVSGGWSNEMDRPIYFLEHRNGWMCAWCSLTENQLIALPHPASSMAPVVFSWPHEVEVLGQVVGVANRLTAPAKPRVRS